MAEDKESKTEEPTSKRLGKARNEGNVPQSQEVKSFAMLLAGLIVFGTMIPGVAHDLGAYLKQFIASVHTIELGPKGVRNLLYEIMVELAIVLAFPLATFLFFAITNGIVVHGLLWTPKKMKMKLSSLSPISGFKRLFSKKSLIEAGKGIIKIAIVGGLIFFLIYPLSQHPDQVIDQELTVTLKELHYMVILVLFLVVMIMFVIAVADLKYQRWDHKEKLKMTKQEVKDEHKETEGDPKIKRRIRTLQLQRHRQRMMAAVPSASVVITNPTHYAVALKYDMDSMAAPVLVAKGVDYLAWRIRRIADESEVPIVENPPLARALYAAVEVDQEIPPEHYKAVAEIIGYVMQFKDKLAS